MDEIALFFLSLMLLANAFAAYTDKRWGIIPNILTYPLLVIGFFYVVFSQQWLNLTIVTSLLLIGFLLKKTGYGDIKLLSINQLFIGFIGIYPIIFIYGAIMTILFFFKRIFTGKKDRFRMGPYLLLSNLIFLLFLLQDNHFLPVFS